MPRIAKSLGPIQIKNITKPGYHSVGEVSGLYLQVTPPAAKSWVLRIVVGQKRREIGLGGYPALSLADARQKARQARQQAAEGVDPVEAKKEVRSRLIAAQTTGKTFAQCAEAYIEEHEAKWSNPKHAAQWRSTLETYANPVLGRMLVRDIETPNILAVLKPIWLEKTVTAKRVQGRMEQILDWATTSEYRSGPNPARWRGHLKNVLPSPKKVAPADPRKAVPVADMPDFMRTLRTRSSISARALEFLILTAVRSGNVRLADWSEIDLESKTWTIPGAKMKGGIEHRVPLADPAIALLKGLPRMAGNDLVFPGNTGKPLSDMALTMVMRKMKVEAVPHGFRAAFRTWAGDETTHATEAAEKALAHKLDPVEAAYMRGNLFDKRSALMQDWAQFLAQDGTGKVMAFRKRTA